MPWWDKDTDLRYSALGLLAISTFKTLGSTKHVLVLELNQVFPKTQFVVAYVVMLLFSHSRSRGHPSHRMPNLLHRRSSTGVNGLRISDASHIESGMKLFSILSGDRVPDAPVYRLTSAYLHTRSIRLVDMHEELVAMATTSLTIT